MIMIRALIALAVVAAYLEAQPAIAADDVRLPDFERVVIDSNASIKPYYKMVGDLTGDGQPEIVVCGWQGPVMMYSGKEWKKTVIIPEGTKGGVNGEVADINGDGANDLVLGLGGAVWFENPKTESGTWKQHQLDDVSIHDVEVADLDGDGRPDVVARNQSAFTGNGNEIFIYYQHQPGSWKKENFSCTHGEGLKVADVDGDGHSDILIGATWFRNESGRWVEHVYAADWTELDVKVDMGDVNGDGRPDIVATPAELKSQQYKISWFECPEGDKTGMWKEHVIVPEVECVIHSLALADVNQDGTLDVAYAEMHQGVDPDEVVVMYNRGQGTSWQKSVIDTAGSHELQAADLDGDGDIDLMGANHSDDCPVVVWINSLTSANSATDVQKERLAEATLPLDRWERHVIDADRPARAVLIKSADLNGDGHRDVAAGAWWYQNPGSNDAEWKRHEFGQPLNNMAAIIDFDGDERPDVLGTQGQGSNANSQFVWARNLGQGRFQILDNIQPAQGDFLQGCVAARFDPDGPLQVALSWHREGQGLQMLTTPADPVGKQWTWQKISDFSQDEDLSAGDIDRDGHTDLCMGTNWLRRESDGWSLHNIYRTPEFPDRNRLADVNGDGRLDCVVGYQAISIPGLLAWYEQPEDPFQQWTEHVVVPDIVGPMSLDVADMNGDGSLDLVAGEHNLKQPETSRLYVFENVQGDGSQWAPHKIHVGDEHHDGAIIVDIDGDGDNDVISLGWSHPRVLLYENKAIDR